MIHGESYRSELIKATTTLMETCRGTTFSITYTFYLPSASTAIFKMSQASNHAIVYGASGLIGWALVNELLSPYPRPGSFSKITAVTNRPLDLSESFWPEPHSSRPELQLVSGINLRDGNGDALADSLKGVVNDIETVTHIYYLGRPHRTVISYSKT